MGRCKPYALWEAPKVWLVRSSATDELYEWQPGTGAFNGSQALVWIHANAGVQGFNFQWLQLAMLAGQPVSSDKSRATLLSY